MTKARKMTSPRFNTQISLGNIIQIALLLIAVAGGYVSLQDAVADGETVQRDHEARIRSLENASVRQGADFRAMNQTLRDIKDQQAENNRLLRQLLSRGVD
jgi:hypothetical protein